MKKILKILMLAVMMAACVMTAVACGGSEDGGSDKKGLQCKTKNGVYTIYKYIDDGETKVLDIGAKLDAGVENVKIGANAFSGNDTIEEIIVPSTVTAFEEGAFAGMKKLKKITIPFVGASANADVTYGDSAESTDKATDVARTFGYLFGTSEYDGGSKVPVTYNASTEDLSRYMPSELRTVVIKAEAGYKIPMDAFNGCKNLTKIELSSGITEIGENAFKDCINVVDLVVPATVSVIHKGAFTNCIRLNANVIANATALETIGESAFEGAFDKDHPVELTLPANIVIAKKAFSGSFVKKIAISGNVKIGDSAFASCTKLVAVTFESATGTINQFAFKGATKLTQFGNEAGKINTDGFVVESLAFDPVEEAEDEVVSE